MKPIAPLLALLCIAAPLRAEAQHLAERPLSVEVEPAADFVAAPEATEDPFDLYVLALSWNPSWCASQLARGDGPAQCAASKDLGFLLHGLWPQFSDGGWPEYCPAETRDPDREESDAMSDIMGSGRLAWYQWKKHGRCSGLSGRAYYALSRRAFRALTLPVPPRQATADDIEAAFIKLNPELEAEDMIVTCVNGAIREARICLSRDLSPRVCPADVARDSCALRGPLTIPPVL